MARGPDGFNLGTLVMLLGMGAAGYWTWKFFPHYFTAWQVDHALSNAASRSYKISQMREPFQTIERRKLIDDLTKKIQSLGVVDPELTVDVSWEDNVARATSDYNVAIQHPVVDKITILEMHRHATADLKKVDWDN
jgi:hypothetical protein